MRKIWIQIIFMVFVLAFGIITAALLIASRKPPKQQERKVLVPLVNVEIIHKQDIGMVIRGYGTAKAKNRVQLIPQVSGRIIALHDPSGIRKDHCASSPICRRGFFSCRRDPVNH